MDFLRGSAPDGFHSVHGVSGGGSSLNYDELVVYAEEAVLPYLLQGMKMASRVRISQTFLLILGLIFGSILTGAGSLS